MSIEVTARHIDVQPAMQEYARRKAEELLASFPRTEHVHVILDAEKHRRIAEVVVQGKGHVRAESREVTDNMHVSLDKAFDRIEKQMRKHRDIVVEEHHHREKPR